jgi:hypothetical protein
MKAKKKTSLFQKQQRAEKRRAKKDARYQKTKEEL